MGSRDKRLGTRLTNLIRVCRFDFTLGPSYFGRLEKVRLLLNIN